MLPAGEGESNHFEIQYVRSSLLTKPGPKETVLPEPKTRVLSVPIQPWRREIPSTSFLLPLIQGREIPSSVLTERMDRIMILQSLSLSHTLSLYQQGSCIITRIQLEELQTFKPYLKSFLENLKTTGEAETWT